MFSHSRKSPQVSARPKRKSRSASPDLEPEAVSHPGTGMNTNAVLALQRSHGNRFVSRLITRQTDTAIQRNPHGQDDPKFIGPLTAEAAKKRAMIARLEKTYGIKLDNEAGIKAVNKFYFYKDRGDSNPFKLQEEGWTMPELEALEDMLKKFAPIMGTARAGSTLKGSSQEVTTMSRVDVGLEWDDRSYLGADYLDTFYFSQGKTEPQVEAITRMTDAELKAINISPETRDFIKDSLPRWRKRNADAKSGKVVSYSGLSDTHTRKAPTTGGQTFSDSHNISLYNIFKTNPGPLKDMSQNMRRIIAHELAHALIEPVQLGNFLAAFSDYWKNEKTRVTGDDKIAAKGIEAPISNYGAENARDDLAETAGYYFSAPDKLEKGIPDHDLLAGLIPRSGMPGNAAPRRKAFMDRVVAEWTSAPIKTFGEKSDAVLNLKDSAKIEDVEAAYTAAQAAYTGLKPDEQKKVKKQYDDMTAHYKTLKKKLTDKAPAADPKKQPVPSR